MTIPEYKTSEILPTVELLYTKCKGGSFKSLQNEELADHFNKMEEGFGLDRLSCLAITPFIYQRVIGKGVLDVSDLKEWLACSFEEIVPLYCSLRNLIQAGYVSKNTDREDTEKFELRQKVFTSIIKGTPLINLLHRKKTVISFLEQVANVLESYSEDEIEMGLFDAHVKQLISDYDEVEEVKFINDYKLSETERNIFFLVAYEVMVKERNYVDVDELMKLLRIPGVHRKKLSQELLKKDHELMTKELLAFSEGNYKSVDWMTLGEQAQQILIGGEKTNKKKLNPTRGVLIMPDSIKQNTLFYNEAEEKKIRLIEKSITPDGYPQLIEKLVAQNLHPSLTVLLQGGPGVGKTSSVYWLAKNSGRAVFKVEIEKIHDMYVGESEKNLARIFAEYEKLKESQELCPILLLNECDNLLKSRISHEQSATDQMANNMTTMMLEKMENFKGILFATVNQVHFDEAFSRRFLYKIPISAPDENTRYRIVKDMCPELSDFGAFQMASEYNLTGANIANIRKRYIIRSQANTDETMDSIMHELCKEEVVLKSNRVEIRGFQASKNS